MTRPYSNDLRERVVGAVERGELSCRQAAAHYGVGISTAIKWVQRLRRTGSVSPSKIGGYRPKKLIGSHVVTVDVGAPNGTGTVNTNSVTIVLRR